MLSEYKAFPNRFAVIVHLLNPQLHLLKIQILFSKLKMLEQSTKIASDPDKQASSQLIAVTIHTIII